MPIFSHFRPDIIPAISNTELWRGQDLINVTDRVLNFGFEPVITGQIPRIFNHFSGIFTQKITGEVKVKISFILKFTSESAIGTDGQLTIQLSNESNIFSTESIDFEISDRAGEYNETNHLFGNIQAIVNNTFQVSIVINFKSNLLQIGLSEVRLFAKDFN